MLSSVSVHSNNWEEPCIPPDDDFVEMTRILLILNHWGHIEELDRHTASNYFSSAKQYYTEQMALTSPISPVWDTKGHNAMMISQVHTIPSAYT